MTSEIHRIIFRITLDNRFPLQKGEYRFTSRALPAGPVAALIAVEHHTGPGKTSAFEVAEHLTTQPQPETHGLGPGHSIVLVAYDFGRAMSEEDLDAAFGSDLWRLSWTAQEFLFEELNRVVDLHRRGDFPAYLAPYYSAFNVIEMTAFAESAAGNPRTLFMASGKTFAPDRSDPLLAQHVAEGLTVPHHYKMYLDARKAHAEGRSGPFQAAVANALEDGSRLLLDSAVDLAGGWERAGVSKNLKTHERFERARVLLGQAGFSALGKEDLNTLLLTARRYRNAVQHGQEKRISVPERNEILAAADQLLTFVADGVGFAGTGGTHSGG